MASQTIRIVIVEQGSKKAAKELDGIGKSASGSEKALGLLKAALAAIGVGALIREYAQLSDTYQTLQNRIRLVVSSQREQIAVTRELLDISNGTFTSLKDSTELYARLAFNTRNLGLTQREVLDVTKALNQAVILSGAGTREASNAIIQLSQGLASGTLRGDELRSVLEQLPFVADVLAQELEVDRSALRRLGAEGEITSEKIVKALANAAPRINQEFQNIEPTIGQSFQVLQNQILATVAEFNNATGASQGIAEFIRNIADGLTDVADIAVVFAEDFSAGLEVVGGFLEDTFGIKLQDAQVNFRGFLRFVGSFVDTVVGLLVGVGAGFATFFRTVGQNLLGIGQRALNGVATLIEAVINTIIKGLNTVIRGVESAVNGLISVANDASNAIGQGDLFKPVNIGNLVDLSLGRVNETEIKFVGEEVANQFVAGFESVTAGKDFVNDLLSRADARREARQREGRDLGQRVRNPAEGRNFSTANDILILQLREQLELEGRLLKIRGSSTALEIAQAEALEKLNKKITDDKITLNAQQRQELEGLARANAERRIRNDLEKQVSDFTRDVQDQLSLLQFTTDEREVEADLLRITNQYKQAGIAIDEAQISNLREIRTELQQRINDEETLNSIFGDRAALLRQSQDLERLRQAETDPNRRRGIERQQAQNRIDQRQGDPSLIAGFENGVDQLFLKVSDVAGGIEEAFTNAFSGAEDALVQFVQTGEFNFSGLVDSILADITRLLARQAVLALFNALTGGTSGAFGGVLGSLLGRASGGPVTGGRPYIVGEKGPEIFTPPTSGTIIPNKDLQSGGSSASITVVNVLDPSLVTSAMNGPQGRQVILNVISQNKQAVKNTLEIA